VKLPEPYFALPGEGDLALALLQPHHADVVFALVDANRERLERWLPWPALMKSADDERKAIRQLNIEMAQHGAICCAVIVEGDVVGGIGMNAVNVDARSCDIGYWLIVEAEGRGYMTRSVQLVLGYVFGPLGFNRVTIHADPANVRSCRVPERLGFRKVGVMQQACALTASRAVDVAMYELLACDWRQKEVAA